MGRAPGRPSPRFGLCGGRISGPLVACAGAHAQPELIDAVAAAGRLPGFPDLAEELLRHWAVIPLIHETSRMEVDLVIAGAGLEELALSRATRVSLDGVPVPR